MLPQPPEAEGMHGVSQGPGLGHSSEKAGMGSIYIPTKKAA